MSYRGAKFANVFQGLERWSRDLCQDYAAKGGEVMTERTRAHTPVDTGELKASWKVREMRRVVSLAYPAYESGTETSVEYAPYVEHGTGLWGPKHAKYPIRPKNPEGWLHWQDAAGDDHFAKLVMHPGSKGQHMLAEGMQDTLRESEVFGEEILRIKMTERTVIWDKEAARGRADMTRP